MTSKRNHSPKAKLYSFFSSLLFLSSRYPLVIILAAIIVVTGVISPQSIYPKNLLNVSKLSSVLGVIAIGQTMAVLTGGVDLSTGAVTTLSLTVASGLMRGENGNILWVTAVMLAIAVCIGLVNAFMIIRARVHPMIATLATSALVQGAYLLYTKGAPKGGFPSIIRFIGRGNLFGVFPVSVLVWLGLSAIAILVLRKTQFGRSVYCVGSNPVAAQLSGINSARTIALVYIISSVCSVLAGLLLGGFIGVGTLQLNTMDYSFTPVTAVLMGGTTFVGAQGGVGGTILGIFVLQLLTNLLTILRMAKWVKFVLQGVLIISAIAFYAWRKKAEVKSL